MDSDKRDSAVSLFLVVMIPLTVLACTLVCMEGERGHIVHPADAWDTASAQEDAGSRMAPSAAQDAPADVEDDARKTLRISEQYARIPLYFEENQGQTSDAAAFLARSTGYTVFLARDGEAVLSFRRGDARDARRAVVRMKPVHANRHLKASGVERADAITNYYVGNDPSAWREGVPNYRMVRYEDVYPGIDLLYHGNQRSLEYDFVVSPGADPGVIELAFEGVDHIGIEDDVLLLQMQGSVFRQYPPSIYQWRDGDKHAVAGRYVMTDDAHVKFELASFDPGMALVIDPTLVHSTYFGGSASDFITDIVIDSMGRIVVTGGTDSTDFPGAMDPAPGLDAFVSRLRENSSNNLVLDFTTIFGGTSDENGGTAFAESNGGVAIGSAGGIFVTGSTSSFDFPQAGVPDESVFKTMNSGRVDAFLAKFGSAGGTLQFAGLLGGDGDDYGLGIDTGTGGSVFLTGRTGVSASIPFPALNTAVPNGSGVMGSGGAFVTKAVVVTDTVMPAYSTHLGGSTGSQEQGFDVKVFNGDAFVVGETDSSDFPTTMGPPHASALPDAFVSRLVVTATVVGLGQSRLLGGTDSDHAHGIALDAQGRSYITGETLSSDFPTSSTPFDSSLGGSSDVFITRLASGFALEFSTFLGGGSSEAGLDVAVDPAGQVFVTGKTFSSDFPTAGTIDGPGAPPNQLRGFSDAFLTILDPSGSSLVFSHYFGGTGDYEAAEAIALDQNGAQSVFIAGDTDTDNNAGGSFPLASFQPSYGGGTCDAFLAKLDMHTLKTVKRLIRGGTDVTAYRMVGGGDNLDDNVSGGDSVENDMNDLGDPFSVRAFAWDRRNQVYNEIDSVTELDSLPGGGFLISRADRRLDATGIPQGGDFVSAPLHPGWNIIGYPFCANKVNIDNCLLEDPNNPGQFLLISEPSVTEIDKNFYHWDGSGTYKKVKNFGANLVPAGEDPLVAVWVFLNHSAPLKMKIPASSQVSAKLASKADALKALGKNDLHPPMPPAIGSASGGGGGDGWCFIATAASGSYEHAAVRALRRFRDEHLQSVRPGRGFVDTYYRVGATLAAEVRRFESLRACIREELGLAD